MKYLNPLSNLVRATTNTDAELQALTQGEPGGNYYSAESGTYYYDPAKQIPGEDDLIPTTLKGMFARSDQQLIQVSDEGIISGYNLSGGQTLETDLEWIGPYGAGGETVPGTRTIVANGQLVMVSFTSISGTASLPSILNMNSQIPEELRPLTDQLMVVQVVDNGVKQIGTCILTAAGTCGITASIADVQFSGTGTTGFTGFTISYLRSLPT